MIEKGIASLIIMILAVVAANCQPTIVSSPVASLPSNEIPSAPTMEPAWKSDWDKTVAAAKQEGRVIIYNTAGGSQREALRQGLKQAYGIELESVTGRGAELREKLFRERRAGLYLADIFLMGPSAMLTELKPVGVLDPIKPQLTLPEVVEPKAWYGGGHLYEDKEQTYVLAFSFFVQGQMVVNTDLVKPGDIKVYADLLHPRWKGKIVINDPTTSGAGEGWYQMVALSLGHEFMRKLADQEPVIIRDLRQQTEWVARGKYAVLLGPQKAAVAEFMTGGAPLRYLNPSDLAYGSCGAGAMALINRPAHPNAARVFINWLLTREGQTVFSKAFLVQSARTDVPTDHLDPLTIREPGVVYLNSDLEDYALQRPNVAKEAASIFGLGPR